MAYFEMHVELDNAAFEDNDELVRILRDTAERVARLKPYPLNLFDCNGNKVGTANVVE